MNADAHAGARTGNAAGNGAACVVIEVFADIWCPFAHVGLRVVLAERDKRGRNDIPLVVRAWPLELVNGAPMNPERTAEHITHLRDQLVPDLFAHFDPAHFPTTTIPALALVHRAYRISSRLGETASLAVRDELFEHGRNVADPDVLSALGERLGIPGADQIDRDAVTADWEEGKRRGVIGSPHFFCGEHAAFCPSLRIVRDPDHGMSISMDPAKLFAFLDAAFGT